MVFIFIFLFMKLFSYLFIKDTNFELTIKYMALGTLTRIGNVQKGSSRDLLTTKMTGITFTLNSHPKSATFKDKKSNPHRIVNP